MRTIPEESPRPNNDNEGVGKTQKIRASPPANHEVLAYENEIDFDFFEENGGEMHDVREDHGTDSLDDLGGPEVIRQEIVCFIRLNSKPTHESHRITQYITRQPGNKDMR